MSLIGIGLLIEVLMVNYNGGKDIKGMSKSHWPWVYLGLDLIELCL